MKRINWHKLVLIAMDFYRKIFYGFCCCVFYINAHSTELYPTIEQILDLPKEQIDLGLTALIIEKQYRPEIDINASLNRIDEITNTLKQMPDYGDSQLERMGTILRYFYTPSEWNQHQPYQYDLNDLRGRKNPVSTVSYLLKTKYGNCLSLPTLITILGQRLDVDIKLVIAPGHAYAHFKDEQGNITNVEATSGTLLPDESYIRNFNIHPDAVRNQIYMQSLSKEQTIAVLLIDLGRHYMHKGDYIKSHYIADLALSLYPKLPRAMLLKGSTYGLQLEESVTKVNQSGKPLDIQTRQKLDLLVEQNLAWFEKAEGLGWREPPPDADEKYLQTIERFKKQRR